VLVILLLVLSAGIYFFTSYTPASTQNNSNQNSGPTEHSVNIQNFAFIPSDITIKVGDTVTWNNIDSTPHTVTSDSGTELNSQTIMIGNSYSHTFSTAGNYSYHCSIHKTMKGEVIVQ